MALREKLPERYPKIIAMYARGSANALDLLKTDFGHWPPNGLDIVRPPDFDIKFKSVFQTLHGLKRLVPSFTNIVMTAALGGTMGAVYFGVSALTRALELGGFVEQGKSTIHINDLYRGFSFFQRGRRFLSHVISHEFKHVVQGRDSIESLSSAFNERLNIENKFAEDKNSKMLKYFAEECEMQARMHTVVVGAYHQFESMPANAFELLAVLHSQKIELPETQLSFLRETRSGRAALQKYKRDDDLYNRYADKSAISDLNGVVEAIAPKHEGDFWENDIPFIYGDLLELYGDSLGHKRMGHTHNIQLREVFYKAAAEFSNLQSANRFGNYLGEQDVESTKRQIEEKRSIVKDVLHQMPVDDAVSLGGMILRGKIYHEHGAIGHVQYENDNNSIGKLAIGKIWARADLAQSDRLSLRSAYQQHVNNSNGYGFDSFGISRSLPPGDKFSEAHIPVIA